MTVIARVLMVWVLLGSVPVWAEGAFHAGLNGRTELGTHQVRLQVGGRLRSIEAALVVDALWVSSSQQDHDGVVAWWFADDRFAAFAGWRSSRLELLDRSVWHQKILSGMLARLPQVGSGRIQLVAGVEVCVELARHGDGMQTQWIDPTHRRVFDDLVNVSLFARAEIAFAR